MNKDIKIIAEIGWNHMGDMELAKDMIWQAAAAGADYAKFQTWSVERLKEGAWDTDGRREIYEKAELSLDDHLLLKEECDEAGIGFMSAVFSIEDAKLLNSVTKDIVKIPSFESRDENLIEHCAINFDKIIMSTGTSTTDEIGKTLRKVAVSVCGKCDVSLWKKLSIMHCVSSYPLDPKNSNIMKMIYLKNQYPSCGVGYSDHCEGIETAKIAIGLGADWIEKHFTTNRDLPGRDNKFAILPDQLKELVRFRNLYLDMIKNPSDGIQDCEADSRANYTGRFNKK